MRHLRRVLMLLLCIGLLTTVVFADNSVTNVSSASSISSNGS